MTLIKEFLSNVKNNLEQVVNNNIEDLEKITELIKSKLDSNGRALIILAGKNAEEMENLLKTFDFYFKLPSSENLRVIVPGRRYKSDDLENKWQHFESNESIGAIHSQELELNDNDVIVALSTSKDTKYILSFLKNAKVFGAATVMISTPKNNKTKLDYVDMDIEIQITSNTINGTFVNEASIQIKLLIETILFNLFEKNGQIYDGYIMTTKMWTEKLREVSIKTIEHFLPDYDFESFDKDLEECENELSILLVKYLKNLKIEECKALLEKHNYNFKKII